MERKTDNGFKIKVTKKTTLLEMSYECVQIHNVQSKYNLLFS